MIDITFEENTKQLFGRNMTERTNRMLASIQTAARNAARTAQSTSQGGFTYSRVADAAPRKGRKTTKGQFPSKIRWDVTGDNVELNIADLNKDAPYWIIQEIGTGERAQVRRGGAKQGRGRPRKGEPNDGTSRMVTVKSQVGRRISSQLAFGTGPRGNYSAPGAATGEQIYLRRKLRNVPPNPRQIVIHQEIEGQHFVRDGARAGFRQYRPSVLAAARNAFMGHPYRP